MSGFGAEEDRPLSREAGFFEHLTKPVDWVASKPPSTAPRCRPRRRIRATMTNLLVAHPGGDSGPFPVFSMQEP